MVAGLIVLLALPFATLAAEGEVSADQQAAWQMRLDKAAALQAESKARQDEADELLVKRNAECATKFLINDCRNAAAREHLKTTREARRLGIDGRAIEREVKREQLSDRNRVQAEEAPRRAADLELRQAESMNARQAAEDKMAATRAAKAAKAAEGEKRKIAEAEKQRKKQADHDARVAQKKREAEQRAAQAAEKK
ncbi:MAG: biopolymer transport protein TolA [Rhodocyclaceae bacterium]|nr:MAG: biopolymer transport protein TolA [Rhodocyclaceae bacterium]